MIRTAASLGTRTLTTQVCVIGSGPVGQTAALRLSRYGTDVVLLEAGGVNVSPTSLQLMASGGRAVGDRYPDLCHTAYAALGGTSSRPSIELSPAESADVGIRLRPLDPVDLEPRPAAGLAGWPLSYQELRTATEEAARLFGIASLDNGTDLALLRGAHGLASVPFHIADRRVFSEPDPEALSNIDIVLEAPVHALEVGPDGRIRRALVRTVQGEKLEVQAVAFVLAMGTASTCRLLLGSTGAGPAGTANSSGLVGRGLMDHPLVTAGWLTPRDGARDQLAVFGAKSVGGDLVVPKLVPAPDLVRRDLVAHCWATLIPRSRAAWQSRLIGALRRTGQRTEAVPVAGALLDDLRSRRPPRDLGRKLATVASGVDDVAREWLRLRGCFTPLWSLETPFSMSGGSPPTARSLEIAQCVEQLPDDDNRLVLTQHLDPAGRPRPRVYWRWSEEDSRREQAFAALVRDALHDAGLGRIIAPVTAGNRHVKQWSAHHLSGGTRMSATPSTGVVDQRCRTHDHPNLWIAGTSVFPTNGCANPTLTAVATGVIVADDILNRHMSEPPGSRSVNHAG